MNSPTRRQFLTTASLGLIATAFPGRSEDQPSTVGHRHIRKGIMYGTVGVQGTVMEKFKAIKEAGFAGVEPMSHMNQDEVMAAKDATGLETPSVCCSTHWAKPLSHPSESVRAEGVEGMKQALHDAKRYGSRSVLCVPGIVSKEISYADCYRRSQEELRKLVPVAEELRVKIAIENVWNNFLLSPLEAARFVDELNSPMVGWHFDVGNVINYGWPEQWVRVLGKRIVTLHIKEFSRAKADKSGKWAGFDVEFLKGDDNWPAVMKALDDVGFDGWGIAEQPGAGSPEGLKKLSGEMDQIFASA